MIIVAILQWSLFAWFEARKVSNVKEKIINRCHPFFIPDTKHVFCHLMSRWLSVKFWYKYLFWWTISLMQANLEIEDSWRTFWVKSFWKITSRILCSCLFFLSFSVVGCHSDGSQQDTKNICWKMLFGKGVPLTQLIFCHQELIDCCERPGNRQFQLTKSSQWRSLFVLPHHFKQMFKCLC